MGHYLSEMLDYQDDHDNHASYNPCNPQCYAWQANGPVHVTPTDAEAIKAYTTGAYRTDAGKSDERVELVNHPSHYGGDTTYETIRVIEAWELGFCLGNAVKYVSRAGKKNEAKTVEDLKKAVWYIEREIKKLESN